VRPFLHQPSFVLVLTAFIHPVTIFAVLFLLVCSGFVMYFPHHLVVMQRRAVYYLWGQEGGERYLWQWLGLGGGLHKEL
jgi:cytochrome b subunit of formate dehydrogenase